MTGNDKYREIVRGLMTVDKLHRSCIDKSMQELGVLRNQHMILMYIAHRGVDASQTEIAKEFDISPAAVTLAIKNLERSGYVIRTPDETDSRRNVLTLTDKGVKLTEDTADKFDGVDRMMFAGLDDRALDELKGYLDHIINNLKKGGATVEKMV